ncbi:MAG: biopolymer transport protein TolR [Pseudomonadota bacterium]|nr:biopolymer transport protein TolR [Pseudomonadota bacterium]
MAIHSSSQHTAMAEINVTPLVDVMLVLLVIFIVTAPLLTQSIKVSLPKTETVAPSQETRTIQITLNAQGELFLDQQAIDFENLETGLKELVKTSPELATQIHADENTRYAQVARVLAVAQKAGITKLGMVTQAE